MTKTWIKFLWGPLKGHIKHAAPEHAEQLIDNGMAERANADGTPIVAAVATPKRTYRRTYTQK
jgi:hypothetical protein